MSSSSALSAPVQSRRSAQHVLISSQVLDRLMRRVANVHAAGLKSFGLLVADPAAPEFPHCATEVVFFDPTKNRRNDPAIRPAFEAQGRYFRSYDDAGFVADPAEVLQVYWGVLTILDRASRLRGSVHARATPEVQPAVQG
jgi:hypothetical protein